MWSHFHFPFIYSSFCNIFCASNDRDFKSQLSKYQCDKQLTFRIYCTKFPHISVLKEYLSAVRISHHSCIPYNFPLFLAKAGFMNQTFITGSWKCANPKQMSYSRKPACMTCLTYWNLSCYLYRQSYIVLYQTIKRIHPQSIWRSHCLQETLQRQIEV